MADMMKFDLVSPERSLASFEASEVQIPGAEGDLTAMANHAPTMTTLRPGVLSATGTSGAEQFVVTGGFAEISPAGVTILAEQAIAKADVTQDDIDGMMANATAAVEAAAEGSKDYADQHKAHIAALASDLGFAAN